jgi:transposase
LRAYLNPVGYLWAWLKRHAIANSCPDNFDELHTVARNKLKSAQHRPSIIAACWIQDSGNLVVTS